MKRYDFEPLVDHLVTTHGDDLRWVANYNSQSFSYEFQFIRNDLKTELTGNQLDYVIHRSLAVYNKRHTEEVYFHLGDAHQLTVNYDKGTAVHVFLDDVRGVTIMVEPDLSLVFPDFVEECRDRIKPT